MKKTSILFSGLVFTILGMLVMTSFVISFLFLSFGNNLSWEMFLGIENIKIFYYGSLVMFIIGCGLVIANICAGYREKNANKSM